MTGRLVRRLADARAYAVRRWRWMRSPGHHTVPLCWLRKAAVAPNSEVCLFVTLARGGTVPPHARYHAKAWAREGFATVLVVVVDDLARAIETDGLNWAAGVLLRANRGYDFGAWAAAIGELPELREAGLLAIANDSLFGPLASFGAMLDRARRSSADVVGLTRSNEPVPHLQSFVIFFKPHALVSAAFTRFWRGVRTGTRDLVVSLCELRLASAMARGGLRWEALFPYDPIDAPNATLTGWRKLIEAGFPYLKVQLVRDNPFNVSIDGWQAVLAMRGFDPALAEQHLAGD